MMSSHLYYLTTVSSSAQTGQMSCFISYKGSNDLSLFNIFSASMIDSTKKGVPGVFSRNLITAFNDGPVTFHPSGNLIAYSRNIDIKIRTKNLFDMNNNLGIYFAELIDGEWTNVKPFSFNDTTYSNTTPWFSPDGQFLYYASNMPGGVGGTDIYRSELVNGIGENRKISDRINSAGNEGYRYQC